MTRSVQDGSAEPDHPLLGPSVPENIPPTIDPTTPAVQKKRGVFAFFFKSVLGCMTTLVLVLVVLVLLLPTIASGPITGYASDQFAERFQGQLEVDSASLAWFGEQKLDGVVVRDSQGQEIVRASLVLPSLVSLMSASDGKVGRVSLIVDADLVQDDAGVTNLQRALEERKPSTPTKDDPTNAGDDPLALLAKLDLDLSITSKKLSWSDRETRRLGLPFEVRDLVANVTAKPGAPTVVHADGRVVSEQPGALKVDAKINGPIDMRKAWPFGKVDAAVRIEGFSTAMVDGLANQHGNVVEVLGNRFTLTAKANGVTLDSGDVEVVLAGEHATITMAGRFENQVLRSGETGGFSATFPAPRGFLTDYVDPNLPVGTTLALDAGTEPWTIVATNFAIPFPPAGASDFTGLRTALEQMALALKIDVPSRFAFENDITRAGGVKLAARAIQVSVKLAPGEPISARLTSTLDSGREGSVVVDVMARDAWKKLAEKALPIIDIDVAVKGLATAAIGALAGQTERMTSALGSTLELSASAKNASLDAGELQLNLIGREGETTRLALDLPARIEGGKAIVDGANKVSVRLSPSAEWLAGELAAVAPAGTEVIVNSGADAITIDATNVVVPLPDPKNPDMFAAVRKVAAGTVHLKVAGASYADATLKAANTRISTSGIDVSAKLAARGALTIGARGAFQQGTGNGTFVVDAAAADAFAFADTTQPLPPIDAQLVVTDLPAGLVDAFVQHQNVVERALGSKLSLRLDAQQASTTSGVVKLVVDAPNAKVSLAGGVEGGRFTASGADALHVELRIPANVVRDELASMLPPDTKLKWPSNVAAITFDAREMSVALPKPGATPAFDLNATLDSLAAHVTVSVAGVGIENPHTLLAKIEPSASDIIIDAVIAPNAKLVLKIGSKLSPGRDAKLAVEALITEPFALVQGAPMKPVDGKIELTGLDTTVLDALAGQDGVIAGLLGPELRVSVVASNASSQSGALVVDAASSAMTMHVGARFDDAGLHMVGQDDLALTITPNAAFVERYTTKMLPPGTRLKLASDAGPLSLRVSDVMVPMPKTGGDATLLQQLSKLAFVLEADVPGIVYSDAATDAAQRPVTLTGVKLSSTFAPGSQPFATLSGQVVDDPAGEIAADIRAIDPLTKLGELDGKDSFRAKVDVRASRIPTAIVDILARQDGLLVEALGSRIDVSLTAPEISLNSGTFQVDLHSDLHGVKGRGHIESSTVVIDEIDGLVATVGLGPVMSKRVVGKLIPTMVNVQKAADAAPAKFSVDALRFPLDGDLRKLDGMVRIDLGEVSYSLFPELASFFSSNAQASAVKIPMLTVPIVKGVAGYQRLPVKIGDREYIFSGTYDIVTDAAQLTANVPVSLLGKKVSAELEKYKDFIDPAITVPLTIKGSLMKPSIGVDDKALVKVLKDAAEKALEGAAGGLLDDLLKRKKKKKD